MKYQYLQARRVAEHFADEIGQFVERVEIVGSIRREKPYVRDFELLFIPIIEKRKDPSALFGEEIMVDLAHEYFELMLREGALQKRPGENGVTAWGSKNKLAIHVASGMPCDLFATTEENWWMALVIRTGGKESNLNITTAAMKRGEHCLAYGPGFKRQNGEIVKVTSERQVFEHVGLKYLPPKERP